MGTLAERLDAALKHADMTQNALAEKLGVDRQIVSMLKYGKMKGHERWPQIAELLNVDARWLLTGEGVPPDWATPATRAAEPSTVYETVTIEAREVPVIGTVGAADGGQRGVLFDRPELKRLPSKLAAVAVRGNSAYPVAYDGQWVLVNKDGPVRHNNLVVVILEDDALLVKRWCEQADGEHIALASPDGGRDSLVVHRHQVREVWRVVGTYFD